MTPDFNMFDFSCFCFLINKALCPKDKLNFFILISLNSSLKNKIAMPVHDIPENEAVPHALRK